MPSTPESEETRVTDAEVEAAAKAICEGRADDWTILDDRINAGFDARAALEAAAALRQPREDRYRAAEKVVDAAERWVDAAALPNNSWNEIEALRHLHGLVKSTYRESDSQ